MKLFSSLSPSPRRSGGRRGRGKGEEKSSPQGKSPDRLFSFLSLDARERGRKEKSSTQWKSPGRVPRQPFIFQERFSLPGIGEGSENLDGTMKVSSGELFSPDPDLRGKRKKKYPLRKFLLKASPGRVPRQAFSLDSREGKKFLF